MVAKRGSIIECRHCRHFWEEDSIGRFTRVGSGFDLINKAFQPWRNESLRDNSKIFSTTGLRHVYCLRVPFRGNFAVEDVQLMAGNYTCRSLLDDRTLNTFSTRIFLKQKRSRYPRSIYPRLNRRIELVLLTNSTAVASSCKPPPGATLKPPHAITSYFKGWVESADKSDRYHWYNKIRQPVKRPLRRHPTL